MAATYLLRKHLATMNSAGKPEAIAERKIDNEARRRAGANRKNRYPIITPENFEEADRYQNERIAFHRKALGG